MEIKRIKVIEVCSHCRFDTKKICLHCDGKREIEQEVDLDTFMFELAGRLRHYDYIHDHG